MDKSVDTSLSWVSLISTPACIDSPIIINFYTMRGRICFIFTLRSVDFAK